MQAWMETAYLMQDEIETLQSQAVQSQVEQSQTQESPVEEVTAQ